MSLFLIAFLAILAYLVVAVGVMRFEMPGGGASRWIAHSRKED